MDSAMDKTMGTLEAASLDTPFVRVHVSASPREDDAVRSPAEAARPRRATQWGLVFATSYLLVLAVSAIWPSLLVGGDPLAGIAREAFLAPSLAHPLGTDENGRDLLVRLVHGVRPSLFMGLAATAIGLVGGITAGLISGLGNRFVDSFIMRGVDVMLAFPDILLALLVITFFGQGMWNAILAVGVASVPRYARLVRAQVLTIRNAGYVEAAVTLGLSWNEVVRRHVLPNAIRPVLVLATIGIGGKIAAGAGLSFLGLGTPAPSPEWGAMLSVGRNFIGNAWWITTAPAVAITLTVIAVSTVGRALTRDPNSPSRPQ